MDKDLRNRLRRLGVSRGARDLKKNNRPTAQSPASRRTEQFGEIQDGSSLAGLFPGGRLQETSVGACFIVDRVYSLAHQHGLLPLHSLLEYPTAPAALISKDDRLSLLSFRDFLFIDTETTGFGGAGTIAFMVGVAFIEQGPTADALVVRQYFLRDHADETAMLLLLDDLLDQKAGIISFNGRTFDVPLLNTRYLMNRLPSRLQEMPHVDLLPPSRRLWRSRFGSVALGNLEKELLGVRRTEEDIPGWLIPTVYNDYLRSGNAREIGRVFYHNQLDMLSMVTLTAEIMRQFAHATAQDHPLDLFSLGRWQAALGMADTAENSFRLAAAGDLPLEQYHQALKQLGLLLKRSDRSDEAVPVWQQWAATSLDEIEAHIELAMYYEWQERDLSQAKMWTEKALTLVRSWSPTRAALDRPHLEHRLARIQRKLE